MTTRIRFVWLAGVVLLIASATWAQERAASLSACEGQVAVRAAGTEVWAPARIGLSVQEDDWIRVDRGRVVLHFAEGTRYEVRGPEIGSVARWAAGAELQQLLAAALGPGPAEEASSGTGGRAYKGGIAGATEGGAESARSRVRTVDLSLAEEVTVALMPFEVDTPPGELERLGQSVHKLLLGRLGEIEGVRFVERAQLKRALKEIALSMTGAIDPAQVIEVGKLAGARNLILGEITSFPPMVDLAARVVDTETGAIVGQPVHVSGAGAEDVFQMINRLAAALGNVLRSEYKYRAPGPGAPRYDIVYVLDSTGSMGAALEDLRAFVDLQLVRLNRRWPVPDIRVAVVDYKDRTDPYVVNKLDFVPYTESDQVLHYLNGISAAGGGDYPECVYSALMVALRDLAWDRSPQVTRMAFLLADSPPHTMYADEPTMEQVVAAANEGNVTLRIIGFQNLNNSGARIYEQLAGLTNGVFQHYGSRAQPHRSAEVAGRDLERLKGEGTRGAKGGIATAEEGLEAEEESPFLGDVLLEGLEEIIPTESREDTE